MRRHHHDVRGAGLRLRLQHLYRVAAQDRVRQRAARLPLQSVEHALPPRAPCDLILMDPPYGTGLAQAALDRIGQGNWLAPGGWLSIETAGESLAFPPGLVPEAGRRFGKATIFLVRGAE